MTGDITDRIDRLETLVDRQQERLESQSETIERQREALGTLLDERAPGASSTDTGPAIGRRTALKAGGALALLGVGAGTASADPQGQVGTENDPLTELHTENLMATADGNNAIIAETTNNDAIYAETDGTDYNGVHAKNTATTGWSWGVRGETASESSGAYGVRGQAYASSGSPKGVSGTTKADGDGAAGVHGEAEATTGTTYGVVGRNNSPDGAAVYAEATDADGTAVKADGPIDAGDDITFSDETHQRTAGPVAKASISDDGSIDNAVNVDDVTWDDSSSRYEITLTGVNYYYSEYVATVTPLSLDYPVPRTGSGNDKLYVYFDDGNKHNFHVAVYELPNGTETTGGA